MSSDPVIADECVSPDVTATAAPRAEGKRLPWTALRADLQADVEELLGGRVLTATTQPGGFSPGIAARLVLADGRRAFVKAVGEDANPDSPRLHRAEARIAAALPQRVPAPRLLGAIDSGGWVILAFEDVDGYTPAQPWRDDELAQVLTAVADLAGTLTPAPIDAPPAATRFHTLGRGWQLLADKTASGADDPAGVDPWALAHLSELAELERGWAGAVEGTTLAHGDVRADNILLTADQVIFVDWPWACLAPPWFDLVAMLPNVAMNGGPAPEDVLAAHPAGAGADPTAVTTMVAALAGTWTYLGCQPDPPGLPTVRAFQRAHAKVALHWLRQRLGQDSFA
jgi:aminoglycoside phosphotransferase